MDIYQNYLKAVESSKMASITLDEAKAQLYTHYQNSLSFDTGTFSAEDCGYKVKIIKKETVAIDQKLASVIEIGFRKKYELDKSAYKKLDGANKKRVDECLTFKPAKPSFSVERIEES